MSVRTPQNTVHLGLVHRVLMCKLLFAVLVARSICPDCDRPYEDCECEEEDDTQFGEFDDEEYY